MAGRSRKHGDRYPGGKLRQPTLEQRAAAERRKLDAEMAVVLAQPHRRGDMDKRLVSALGRFCKRLRLHNALFEAGEAYGEMKSKWRAAVGAPSSSRLGGSGGDIPMEVVREWAADIAEMESVMLRFGVAALGWVVALAFDERDMPPGHESEQPTMNALQWLAIHQKRMDAPRA